MTLLSKIGSRKISLVTGRDNPVTIDLYGVDTADNIVALDATHIVTGYLVTRDVDKKLAGPFTFSQSAVDAFLWDTIIPQIDLDSGVLINPEAPDSKFVQSITRERSLCYLQLVVAGPNANEPYLLDTHLQRGFS